MTGTSPAPTSPRSGAPSFPRNCAPAHVFIQLYRLSPACTQYIRHSLGCSDGMASTIASRTTAAQ